MVLGVWSQTSHVSVTWAQELCGWGPATCVISDVHQNLKTISSVETLPQFSDFPFLRGGNPNCAWLLLVSRDLEWGTPPYFWMDLAGKTLSLPPCNLHPLSCITSYGAVHTNTLSKIVCRAQPRAPCSLSASSPTRQTPTSVHQRPRHVFQSLHSVLAVFLLVWIHLAIPDLGWTDPLQFYPRGWGSLSCPSCHIAL